MPDKLFERTRTSRAAQERRWTIIHRKRAELMGIDLKKEQAASGERPRYRYSLAAIFFFWSMNLIAGRRITRVSFRSCVWRS